MSHKLALPGKPEPITETQLANAAISLVTRGLRPPEILETYERINLKRGAI